MKKLLTGLILILILTVPIAVAEEVILPDGYESSGRFYPVICVMPQAEGEADSSGLAERLSEEMKAGHGLEMIIVKPVIGAGEDPADAVRQALSRIDADHRTIPDPGHRFAAGTGNGGYLAYMLTLTEDSPFGGAVSVRGHFTQDSDPWASLGSVYEKLKNVNAADRNALNGIYTYMDAPADDPWTDEEGSTDDLGALLIDLGIGSARHEFTVRPGCWDESFLCESARRALMRLTGYMLEDVLSAEMTLSKAVISPQDAVIEAECAVTLNDGITSFAPEGTELMIGLASGSETAEEIMTVGGPGRYPCVLSVPNTLTDTSEIKMTVTLLGARVETASAPVVVKKETVGVIDLSEGWHFNYTGLTKTLGVPSLTKDEIAEWPVVQPGLASWTKGFGNISDENVRSGYGPDYFDFFIIGNGYYARTFTLPEGYDEEAPELSIGCVDDRCEVWLNGVRIGATGMDDRGMPTGDTTWAVFSHFTLDSALLDKTGENLLVVRAFNDQPFGAGGWYAGPIGLYTREAFAAMTSGEERFFEETFDSPHAARALKQAEPAQVPYLIYLPPDYENGTGRYPTMYLMHQFNSDHTSYRTDGIDKLLDEGIREGLFDPMIVVIPNSSEESWWRGEWEKMITEDLIPHIDSRYRTIPDARFRLTAGCSMGGQGAFGVALRNPNFFSGAVSFFGAFSYGGDANPVNIARAETKEYMDYFALYFSCGNQDSYGFGVPAILLHQQLKSQGTKHRFLIENGGHDSAFYLPRFKDALAYTRNNMYHPGELPEDLLSGAFEIGGSEVTVTVEGAAALSDLMLTVPASSYTADPSPALDIPVRVELIQGDTAHTADQVFMYAPDNSSAAFGIDPAGVIDPGKPFSVRVTAWIFDTAYLLCDNEITVK